MGIKLNRQKKKNWLLIFVYRFLKLPIFSVSFKHKLALDLEWIFDRIAHESSFKIYNEEDHPIRKYSIEFILKNLLPEHNILDLGCKYGEISFALSKHVNHVVGVDFDSTAIEVAKVKYNKSNLSFEVADAHSYLKQSKTKFNVLILSHIIEHIDNPLSLITSVASNFDYIYIEVPDFDKTYLNQYRLKIKRELIYSDPDHVFEFDRMELLELIENCGLSLVNVEYRFGVQKLWCKVIK